MDFYAAIAAAVTAARPPPQPYVPKELQWPRVKDTYTAAGPDDFHTWYLGYSQLARHVEPSYKVLHLMSAVEQKVRKNCEGWAVGLGVEVSTLPLHQVCDYIASTYDRVDAKHRRIIAFLRLAHQGGDVTAYLRQRSERKHLLAQDGVQLSEAVERALLVDSLHPPLQASLIKDPGWMTMGLADMEKEIVAS